MRWLALDVGSRRVGVAVCDEEERVATSLPAFPYAGPDGVVRDVRRLLQTWSAGGVVIGVPITRGGLGRGERRVAGVVAALRESLGVPIETADERGTTKAALSLLEDAGVPRRRWQDLVDSTAARLILEGHLATRTGGRKGR